MLVTALNPVIGYELGAKVRPTRPAFPAQPRSNDAHHWRCGARGQVAKEAYATRRSVKEVALERTDLTEAQLDEILDPRKLTQGGICAKPQ